MSRLASFQRAATAEDDLGTAQGTLKKKNKKPPPADEERKIITARHMQSTLLIHLNSRNVCVCALHSVYIYN